jgi:hypothetical protein
MTNDINDAIQGLSKKQHVVSDEAKKAQAQRDMMKLESSKQFNKNVSIIDEFSNSVKLLGNIFQRSNFDEVALVIANPSRILLLNFFIGFVRGLGFCLGLVLIITIIAGLFNNSFPGGLASLFSQFITR